MSQPEAGPSTRPQSQLEVLRFAGSGTNPQAIIQRFTHETTLYRALELRSVFFYNLYELEMCLLESRPARHGNIRRHPPLLIEAPRIKHFRQPAQWILEDRAKKHRRDRILRHDPRERRERDDTRPLTLKDVSNVDLKYWRNILAPFISIAFDNSNLMCHREFPFHDDFSWATNIQSLSFTRIHLHSTTLFKVLIASCPRLRSLTLKEISYASDKALSSHSFPGRDEFASEGRHWGDPIYLEELNLEDLDYRIAEDVLAWFNKMHHKQLVSLSRLKRFKVHVDPFRISSEEQILLERYRGFDRPPQTPRRRGHVASESRATSSRPPTPIFLPPSPMMDVAVSPNRQLCLQNTSNGKRRPNLPFPYLPQIHHTHYDVYRKKYARTL
ncbi:hypothetical protein BDZ89DRAFT_747544 [Hymenopellis radicata]|nr:hypothetical protein BDZ89DRAFT_747544 [Hymenopellis radicata]